MIDVLCVGDLLLDVRVGAAAILPDGDVPGHIRIRPSGASANAAVWAAWSGARAAVIARIGDDLAGNLLSGALEAAGVLALLAVDRAAETGATLVVTEDGERSIVADRGACGRLDPDDLPERLTAHSVLVSGHLVGDPLTRPAARAAIERAHATHVAVDAASWVQIEEVGREAFLEATRGATMLFANEQEAELLAGTSADDAAEALSDAFRVVAVKLGERGAVLCWEGLVIRYEAEEVTPVDPTGAGDAFDGAFLAALAAGRSPADALHAACAAGAWVVGSTEAWPERPAGAGGLTGATSSRSPS